MYAADAFGDVDTRRCAQKYYPLDPLQLHTGLKHLKEAMLHVDGLIIGSGFENADFSCLKREDQSKVLGNAPEKTREIANKAWLSARLDELSIPHPLTYTGGELTELIENKKHVPLHYPVVAKPAYGGGGTANFFCQTEEELIRCAKQLPEFLYQEYMKGTHASVSVILAKREAISVCVNEQLLGVESLGAPGPLVYCGNISPLVTTFNDRVCELAEELTRAVGLLGSNGVDFVITEAGPFVIEVNPRLQGSLDTVELSTGLNIVDAHVKASEGALPEGVAAKQYAAKTIVFAKHAGVVRENLWQERGGIVDIPEKGRIVKSGQPIATGIGIGDTREHACAEAMKCVERIKASVH